MKKFEYWVDNSRHALTTKDLDDYGSQEYELVSVVYCIDQTLPFLYTFKKELTQ
jgi:hypothetical protein